MTVIEDRYLGSYSGGVWIAFNLDPDQIPIDMFQDDVTARDFWESWDYCFTGLGNSCQEAVDDLIRKNNETP